MLTPSINTAEACLWIVNELAPKLIADIIALKATDLKIESKGKNDLLTKIDTHVDQTLIQALRSKYPNSHFLTEETIDSEAVQTKDFSNFSNVDNLWIIDPIDGTANLAAGSRDYAISIALVMKSEVVLGVIIVPEAEQIFYAEATTKQAKLQTPSGTEVLHVSSVSQLDEAKVGLELTGRPALRRHTEPLIQKLLRAIGDMRAYASAVLAFARVAKGEIDAYQCPAYPWDMAAGSLILKQAGGQISTIDGQPWTPFSSDALISNGQIHQAILEVLQT